MERASTSQWERFSEPARTRACGPSPSAGDRPRQDRTVSHSAWETYGWSKDGSAIYGLAIGQGRRLMLGRVDIAAAQETKVSDLGPAPTAGFDVAGARSGFAFRGFSLSPDGKSFLTSIYRTKLQIYLMEGFDRPARLADRWWRR